MAGQEQLLLLPTTTTATAPSQRRSSTTPIFTGAGPNINNIVCGVHLNCRLDHRHISNAGRFHKNTGPARGNKGSSFPAAVLRIKDPKCTALVFDSGKMQVLGAKSVPDAYLAARKFARVLQKMGYQPRLEGFTVQNIVANADTKMAVQLEGLNLRHRAFSSYEPEIFPGLVYRMLAPKVTMLVFAKGKVIFLGAKKEEDIDEAMAKIYPVLLDFRMKRE